MSADSNVQAQGAQTLIHRGTHSKEEQRFPQLEHITWFYLIAERCHKIAWRECLTAYQRGSQDELLIPASVLRSNRMILFLTNRNEWSSSVRMKYWEQLGVARSGGVFQAKLTLVTENIVGLLNLYYRQQFVSMILSLFRDYIFVLLTFMTKVSLFCRMCN